MFNTQNINNMSSSQKKHIKSYVDIVKKYLKLGLETMNGVKKFFLKTCFFKINSTTHTNLTTIQKFRYLVTQFFLKFLMSRTVQKYNIFFKLQYNV